MLINYSKTVLIRGVINMEKRATFKVKSSDWNQFKKYCNLQGSNASTELRRFVKIYNKYFQEHKNDINPDFFSFFTKQK